MVHYFNFLRGEESLSPSLSLSVSLKSFCLCAHEGRVSLSSVVEVL